MLGEDARARRLRGRPDRLGDELVAAGEVRIEAAVGEARALHERRNADAREPVAPEGSRRVRDYRR